MQSNPQLNLQYEDAYLITRERLAELVQTNSTDALRHYGGIENIASALRTNLDVGIKGDQTDLRCRREAFGGNFSFKRRRPPHHTIKRMKHLFSNALRDTTILLLLCCALLSFAIGIKTNGAAEGAADAELLLLTVSSTVCFGAAVRFLRARWIVRKSSKRSDDDDVWVVRNGMVYVIHESELVAGDIAWLQDGDRVPADGLFVDGDDSCSHNYSQRPSLFTGDEVVGGRCRMLVASVGDNTERSRLIRSIGLGQNDRRRSLLDAIERSNSKFDKIWLSLSLILLVVQFICCFVSKKVNRSLDTKGAKNRMEDLMKESMQLMKKERKKGNGGLVTVLLVLLFASREGMPLAIFVSLLYASNRMKSCKAVVRELQSSATVGLTTTICACETPDLALQHAKMAELWIGLDLVQIHLLREVDGETLDALRRGILVSINPPRGRVEEISLLAWARAALGLTDMELDIPDSSSSSSSSSCCMVRYENDANLCCSIVKRESEGEDKVVLHVHWRGAPEQILSMCSRYYTLDGKIENLDAINTAAFNQIVENLVECCFAFAYKRQIVGEEEDSNETALESDLTLLGLVCLKNPYSSEVIEAIEDCRKSGVEVKLMVEHDIDTARIMALNSGLLRPDDNDDSGGGGAIVDADDFRNSSDAVRRSMVDKIRIMANASPADKMLMMQCLRQNRHIVTAAAAATVRDSPLLKQADVGIFMGEEWTEMSKEDGDIMVPTSNFSKIPGIVKLGRRVCRNLEKFMELQLTMEISAFTINIVALAATSKEALSSFEVLWINLMMEILGAAAVAITTVDTSSSSSQTTNDANPVYGSGPIISREMWRSIALQSLFQVGVILMMVMKGTKTLFEVNETMIFNCYALCQVFLLIAAVETRRNDVVASTTWLFLGAVAVIGIAQVAVVEVVGVVAHRPRLDMKQWWICIGIASLSLPLNCAANWNRI